MLFRSRTGPGHPPHSGFLSGSMHESPGHLSPKGLCPQRLAFLFQPGDTEKYLAPEKLSPEVLVLGEHVAQGNPLRRKQFHDEDRRWTHVFSLARSSMRLTAYAGALTNLAMQAYDLRITREDRMLLNSLLLSISELL